MACSVKFLNLYDFQESLRYQKKQKQKNNEQRLISYDFHTDSHPCTKPGWSRSLPEWSRSPAGQGHTIHTIKPFIPRAGADNEDANGLQWGKMGKTNYASFGYLGDFVMESMFK